MSTFPQPFYFGKEHLGGDEKLGKEKVLIGVMKTSVSRNLDKRSPHRPYEDISFEESGQEKSSSPV